MQDEGWRGEFLRVLGSWRGAWGVGRGAWATPLRFFVAGFVRIRTFARKLLRSLTTSATKNGSFPRRKIFNGVGVWGVKRKKDGRARPSLMSYDIAAAGLTETFGFLRG